MQFVGADSIDRDKLEWICMFDAGDAPSVDMGDSWWIAATAIGKGFDDREAETGYFFGFTNIMGARVDAVPEQFNSEVRSKLEEWARENIIFNEYGCAQRLELDRMKVHYTMFHDKIRNCAWGLVFLLSAEE